MFPGGVEMQTPISCFIGIEVFLHFRGKVDLKMKTVKYVEITDPILGLYNFCTISKLNHQLNHQS